MTAKEYLCRYLEADREIDTKLEQLARLRAKAEKVTSLIGGERVQGGEEGSRLESIMEKIIAMEQDVDHRIDELQSLKLEIEGAINALPDAREREVLKLRYIRGLRWEEVSGRMGYEERQIYRIHGRALNSLKMSVNVSQRFAIL